VNVDDYLAAVPPGSRSALETLRKTAKAAAPEATETIGWQMLGLKVDGRWVVTYGAFKDHCSLFPMSRSVIDEHAGELEPYISGRGTLRFALDQPLPGALVKKIVKARLRENEDRSRPQ
jgi:uncharacterized protein YdhG (YjbR/CyaY superfamily)